MDNTTLLSTLRERFPAAIEDAQEVRGDLSIWVAREHLLEVAQYLRDDPALGYAFLEQLCGVDYLGRDPRFEVVVHLVAPAFPHRVCLKIGLPEEDPHIPSLTYLWPTTNYQERETYDLLGIVFDGHPGLSRIMMPDDWIGHPQRKDHPLGDEEIAFTFNQERIYAQKPFAKE